MKAGKNGVTKSSSSSSSSTSSSSLGSSSSSSAPASDPPPPPKPPHKKPHTCVVDVDEGDVVTEQPVSALSRLKNHGGMSAAQFDKSNILLKDLDCVNPNCRATKTAKSEALGAALGDMFPHFDFFVRATAYLLFMHQPGMVSAQQYQEYLTYKMVDHWQVISLVNFNAWFNFANDRMGKCGYAAWKAYQNQQLITTQAIYDELENPTSYGTAT